MDGKRIPVGIPNSITHEFDEKMVGEGKLLVTGQLADLYAGEPGMTLVQRQCRLSDDLTARILTDPTELKPGDFVADFSFPTEEQPACQTGVPEYMVFSAYDTSQKDDMKASPCPELHSRDGHLVTSDKRKLLAILPELTKLHTDVFENQAVQIGYYGGLNPETIEELINNPDFIPIAALDKDTGEPLMFALFSPNFTDLESIDWLNASKVQEMMDSYKVEGKTTTLNLPLVVTSRFEGLGLFSNASHIAAHETIYRTKADTTFLMYECNALSILFTPKIINKKLAKLGIMNLGTDIEATFLTEN